MQIVIITVLWGGFIYYTQNIIKFTMDFCEVLLIILLSLDFVALVINTIFIFLAYYNYSYRYLPLAKEANEYIIKLKEYYAAFTRMSKTKRVEAIENDKNNFLHDSLIECIDENIMNNDKKSMFLHKSSTCFIISLVLLALTAIPFSSKLLEQKDVVEVKIINTNDLK